MARDIWAETEEEVKAEYKAPSAGFEPIPKNTEVEETLEEIRLDSFDKQTEEDIKNGETDHRHINIKWAINAPDQYSHRKYFQTIYINGSDPNSQYYDASKQEKNIKEARDMLLAIDKNAGGFIAALKRKPTEAELQKYLIGAQMKAILGITKNGKQCVWEIKPLSDAPTPKANPVASKPKVDALDDSDIPF